VACQAGAKAGKSSKAKQGQTKREELVKGDVDAAKVLQVKKSVGGASARPASADDPGAPDIPMTSSGEGNLAAAAEAWQGAAPLAPGSSNDPDDREVPITTALDGYPSAGPLAEASRNPDGTLGGGSASADLSVTASTEANLAAAADAWQGAAPLAPGSSNDPDDREVPITTALDGYPSAGSLAEASRNPDGTLGGASGSGATGSSGSRSSATDAALRELAEAREQAAAATAGEGASGGAADGVAGDAVDAAAGAADTAASRVEGALDQGVDAAGARLCALRLTQIGSGVACWLRTAFRAAPAGQAGYSLTVL